MRSESEFERAMKRLMALDRQGSYAEAEKLSRDLLFRATEDGHRIELLDVLARSQMRQGRCDDALETSLQAVRLAHRCNDVYALISALDTRAEIRCMDHDYTGAFRVLQEARKYAEHADLTDNRYLDARLAQTWGMAYNGSGWWEPGIRALRKAADFYEHNRIWRDWGLAVGDLVSVTLHQSTSEGPDIDRLEEAQQLLARAQKHVGSNPSHQLHMMNDHLRLRQYLAEAQRNWPALAQVRFGYVALMQQFGGPRGVLHEPQHFPLLLSNTVNTSRIDRTLIDNVFLSLDEADETLRVQVRLFTIALQRAPRALLLWQERAALHLCAARQGKEEVLQAACSAAACLETCLDILGTFTENCEDSQLRAGRLGTMNDLLQDLASTAAFALREVHPPATEVALRLVGLIQLLRVRGRRDLVRSLDSLRPPTPVDRQAVSDLLDRIRALHRWLERLNAEGHRKADSPIRSMKKVAPTTGGEPVFVTLGEVTEDIENSYPEYKNLQTRAEVEAELRRRKARLDQLATQNVAARTRAVQVREEAPFDLERWRNHLAPDEVVLDYCLGPSRGQVVLLGREQLQIFRLPFDGLRHLRQLAQTHLSPDHLLPGGDRATRSALLAEGVQRCGAWLFPEEIVASLTGMGARRLYVVASGPLWRVPFPWLPAAGQRAFERWEVVLVPSVRLAGGVPGSGTLLKAAAVGHAGEPPLPNALVETLKVATLLGGRSLSGKEATPGRVLTEILPTADLVHFACHGEADPVVPWLSSLQLEPDENHKDGRLMLYEVLATPMRALVVNTAACFTARTEGLVSFPESLAHAFLGAGAHFVVASLWAANDAESLRFGADFYNALREHGDVPRAFRASQLRQHECMVSPMGCKGDLQLRGEHLYERANYVLLGASPSLDETSARRQYGSYSE